MVLGSVCRDLICCVVMIVFLLQPVDLAAQVLVLGALLPVNDHAVGPEHHMQKQPDRDTRHASGGQPAPRAMTTSAEAGRNFSLHAQPQASACGACSTSALSPRWAPGNTRISGTALFEYPLFRRLRSISPVRCLLPASEYTRTTGSVPDKR